MPVYPGALTFSSQCGVEKQKQAELRPHEQFFPLAVHVRFAVYHLVICSIFPQCVDSPRQFDGVSYLSGKSLPQNARSRKEPGSAENLFDCFDMVEP
jgi:hypothetical protein